MFAPWRRNHGKEALKVRLLACVLALSAIIGSLTVATAHHRVLRGRALYYSNEYKGQTMACGGTYQPDKMIAAHRTLPCGTELKVTNKANGRSVVVTVQDRGPFGDKDTILDLSRRAARELDYIDAGSARVRAVIRHD